MNDPIIDGFIADLLRKNRIDQSIEHLQAQFAMASQRDKQGFMSR